MRNRRLKKHVTRAFVVFGLMLLSGCGSFLTSLVTPKVDTELVKLKPGQYRLDKSHAAVLFKVQHLGLSTYVGRFNKIDATLRFDPSNIEQADLNAVIDIGSLDINDESLKEDLMGSSWFNQKKFPQAVFVTKRVAPSGANAFDFTGALTWRGVTQDLVMQVTFNGGAENILTGKYTLGFTAIGEFKRSDFGMDAFIPLVGDQILLEAYAEFQKD